MLNYSIEFKEFSLLIHLSEEGTRRILYLDTLKALAKEADREALSFLTKIHLRSSRNPDTLTFQQIEVNLSQAPEALKLLSKTGRLHFQKKKLCADFESVAKVYWKGEKGKALGAYLQFKGQETALELCEKVTSFCFICDSKLGFLSSQVAWKWVERFLKGPQLLQGIELRKFLDEEPPIVWKEAPPDPPLEVFPILRLKDQTGCFADLWMEYRGVGVVAFEDLVPSLKGRGRLKEVEKQWEKDLLESGYLRKQVGESHYYCPSEKAKETLFFLLSLGWEVREAQGKRVVKQSGTAVELKEENGKIAVRRELQFQSVSVPLRSSMIGKMWIEIDKESVGLIDRIEKIEGNWEEEILYLKKQQMGSLISFLDGDEVKWENTLRNAVEGLKQGATFEVALPDPSFKGRLLSYQQKGVDWLAFLHRWGFSGLLADEMGLGKTVQVLAFFSRLRTNLPILIIAPSSLLYNWRSEIDRFLGVEAYLHAGPERLTKVSELQSFSYILTSYAILRIDEELLSQLEFEAIVLDESNAIKTASTQTAKAACRLKGRFRIALSGTPMENRFDELVSQFRFLLPDLPAPLNKAKVRPFLLRRKKEEVQIELPEKIEQIVWVEMEETQKEAYETFRTGLSLQEGANRIEILEAILRLRQICCDPRLAGKEGEGAKMDVLLRDLEEAQEENRKVLVFSQFTSMLQLIGRELEKRGWNYLYLDGSTSLADRAERVQLFQEGAGASIFLLSLKAGGVGLNLTAADTVVLFDPWWNEAVERQAIDRAHRIGQKKTVLAKRYLAVGSIEEKMLKLKEKKQSASDEILDEGGQGWSEAELLELLVF